VIGHNSQSIHLIKEPVSLQNNRAMRAAWCSE
jgi:hypothetical protein